MGMPRRGSAVSARRKRRGGCPAVFRAACANCTKRIFARRYRMPWRHNTLRGLRGFGVASAKAVPFGRSGGKLFRNGCKAQPENGGVSPSKLQRCRASCGQFLEANPRCMGMSCDKKPQKHLFYVWRRGFAAAICTLLARIWQAGARKGNLSYNQRIAFSVQY